MTKFEDQHSVWTNRPDPAWTAKYGLPDLVLVDGLSLGRARFMCERLLMINPDAEVWIKDIRNNEVARFSNRAPVQASDTSSKPARRKLGTKHD